MTGVMAYVSAPLWFLFLILSTVLLAIHTLREPSISSSRISCFRYGPSGVRMGDHAVLGYGDAAACRRC